jgi:GR25 family glycosyltransferase involved in LPS biosynthesis
MDPNLIFGVIILLVLIVLIWLLKREGLPEIIRNSYCIALPERKEQARMTLESVGIHPTFIAPVLKSSIDRERLIRTGFLSPHSKLNEGRIACHMSHLKTLRKFLDTPHLKTCTIFEDDIITLFNKSEILDITQSLQEDIVRVCKNDRYDWDILYLSKCLDKCNNIQKLGKYLYDSPYPDCRHAYTVTRRGAQRIINGTSYMDKLPGDEMYRRMIQSGKLKAFSCTPQLFWQNRQQVGIMKSNLGNNSLVIPECMPEHKRVTVVIMNYMRPEIVRYIVSQMTIYPTVNEILLLNISNKTQLKLRHPKIRTFDASEIDKTEGVAVRFIYAASYALNNQILFIDDDVIPSDKYIRKLLDGSVHDPNNIYGCFRRICNERDGYITDSKIIGDRHDTILTPVMLTSKQIVNTFLDNKHYAEWMAKDKEKANVIWNGEDLFINMVVRSIYKKNPVFVSPDHKDDIRYVKRRGNEDLHAISDKPGHYEYRKEFCTKVKIPNV